MAEAGTRVTLEDIAAHTGYSRALVSIVLRNAAGASVTTREKVLAAASELGYRPDVRARSLAGQRSWSMGVLFGVAGSFHFDLLDGLYAAAESHRYGLVLSAITRHRDEQQAISTLRDLRFDGLIMLGPPIAHPALSGQVPVAVIGWHVDDPHVDVVRTSDEHGMARAVEHLAALGHRRIAHIDGGEGMISLARREAYSSAMRASGLERFASIIAGGESQLEGQQGARALVAMDPRPTAVIAYNDDVAVATVSLLEQSGLDVPGDVSVVGWDDTATARLSRVALTTVAQQPAELASAAFDRLMQRLDGVTDDLGDIVLEPELVIRSSTGPLGPTG